MENRSAIRISRPYLITDFLLLVCVLSAVMLFSMKVEAHNEYEDNTPTQLALQNLSLQIDARIALMKLIAKSIANDTHIHQWVNQGFASDQEGLLLNKLDFYVQQFQLTSASFADKKTNKYWNHEGFLRELQPDIDTWYFAYLASEEQDLISVYHDKNKNRVDLYVNYQQLEGNGLSGIATSFDGVLEMLNTSVFASRGDVYLVDPTGRIQVDSDAKNAGTARLQDKYSALTLAALFNREMTNSISLTEPKPMRLMASYIPSMNWYLVVAEHRH